MKKCKLIYCAVPSRLVKSQKDMELQMDVITKEGNAPLHPFQAFPFERYEGGPAGKELTWEYCCKLVSISDGVYLFGISHGSLNEVEFALRIGKPVKLLMDKWDPGWKKYYATRTPKIPILDDLMKN